MRVLALSDLHLECSDLDLTGMPEFDVMVLAGDVFCPGSAVGAWVRAAPALRHARAVIWVSGNHEYYDSVLQHEARAMQAGTRSPLGPPLHWLDCGEVVVQGVRFLGCTLWTDFALHIDTAQGQVSDPARGMAAARRRMADYLAIDWRHGGVPRKLTPHDTLRLHHQQRDWLAQSLAAPFDGPTVVVTHHGPHRGSLAPRFAADWVSTAYLSELPAQFFDVPVLWIHGHTHSSHDYRVGDCRVVCNPRGYQVRGMAGPENADFDPSLVLHLDAGHCR